MAYPEVKTVEEYKQQPEEYQMAVRKIVRSHSINELYGARVFDEPAIAFAPWSRSRATTWAVSPGR